MPSACIRAPSCSTRSGATTYLSKSARWTCTSGGCARRSNLPERMGWCRPCAAPATVFPRAEPPSAKIGGGEFCDNPRRFFRGPKLEGHVGQSLLHPRPDRRDFARFLADAGLQGCAAVALPDAARIAAASPAQSVHALSLAAGPAVADHADGFRRLGIPVFPHPHHAQPPTRYPIAPPPAVVALPAP